MIFSKNLNLLFCFGAMDGEVTVLPKLTMLMLFQDFRFAFRQLVKNPGFALNAILSLALGIGATTAVFSVVYAVLLNPYPYKNPERMVHLVVMDRAGHDHWPALSFPQIQRVRQFSGVQSVIGQDDWSLTTSAKGATVLRVFLKNR